MQLLCEFDDIIEVCSCNQTYPTSFGTKLPQYEQLTYGGVAPFAHEPGGRESRIGALINPGLANNMFFIENNNGDIRIAHWGQTCYGRGRKSARCENLEYTRQKMYYVIIGT